MKKDILCKLTLKTSNSCYSHIQQSTHTLQAELIKRDKEGHNIKIKGKFPTRRYKNSKYLYLNLGIPNYMKKAIPDVNIQISQHGNTGQFQHTLVTNKQVIQTLYEQILMTKIIV